MMQNWSSSRDRLDGSAGKKPLVLLEELSDADSPREEGGEATINDTVGGILALGV
jgi:hypothetical protein